MKRYLLLLVLCMVAGSLSAQPMKINTFTLKNGMQVMLCEDHQQPSIYGAVLVHVGGKNDPADNTGMAHYLEHLMFKGTDRIGTTDWDAEKPLLDEIDKLYDALHEEKDPARRNEILKKINDASSQAAQYAIPNEVDVILSKMGGTGVNAFTSNDVTCYHNMFPSNQLEKWLTVYAERFRRPVFRLFQSELEAVYEEFNMYADQPTSVFFEDAIAAAYGGHPYGRPVIGYQEHLKNPQTSAMEKFFVTYYHPYNMTLILAGDFDAEGIKPLLESTMGKLRNEYVKEFHGSRLREAPVVKKNLDTKVVPFNGVQTVTVAETPVKMGVVEFQTVGSADKEAFYLDILSGLLNNEAGTGLLDGLVKENKLMEASAFNYAMLEHGLFALFYVPKLTGQSHEDAEKMVLAELDRLRKGDFSDELFEAVKMEYLRDYYESMESLTSKFYTMVDLSTNYLDPQVYYEREKMIRLLTKDQLVELSRHFFGSDYLCFRSNVGQKDIKRLEKPSWKPIVTKNAEMSSKYAKEIADMPVREIESQVVELDKDVFKQQIESGTTLYYKENPYNDIFTLQLIFQYGSLQDPMLPVAVDYVSYQGSGKNYSGAQFQLDLQKLGASMTISTSDRETYVTISGFDESLPQVLQLCSQKLMDPGNEEKYLDLIVEQRRSEAEMNHSDAEVWGSALYYYALYGKNSPYLTRPSLKSIEKQSGKQLLDVFSNVLRSAMDVTYVGRVPMEEMAEWIREIFAFQHNPAEKKSPVREQVRHSESKVLLADNKQFMQSNIYFLINGEPLNRQSLVTKTLYNEYMGGSMAGVIFQEIRELRSLGYSAYGTYNFDEITRQPGYMMGYLGTQADKTNEGVVAMSELLSTFPKRPEKFEMAKESAIRQMESSYLSFRQMPNQMRVWEEMGYGKDPRSERLKLLKSINMDDVQKFHQANMAGRPIVITIAGDTRRFDTKALKKIGKVVKVKYTDIIVD
ncbi:MAG: insulinase family protein [Bacteroidales bacterium]|nr:insulinase family protein [Bacteroidales bacterium]